jgi:hypothetical protein
MDEWYLVVRYLYEQRPDGRYVPAVSIQLPGKAEATIITDHEGHCQPDPKNLSGTLSPDPSPKV